jgi:chemotaxis protein MotB
MRAGKAKHLDLSVPDAKHNQHSWMISYADMITLLLCFFMLFFKIDDETEKQQHLRKQQLVSLLDLGEALKPGEKSGVNGEAVPSGGVVALSHPAGEPVKAAPNSVNVDLDADTLLASIFPPGLPKGLSKSFDGSPNAKISHDQKDFYIEFSKIEFFAVGSTRLTRDGERSVKVVADALRNYSKDIYVEIEGYADTSKVNANRTFKTNMDLSILRAMTVYHYLMTLGIPKESLSVLGHGEFRPYDRLGHKIEEDSVRFQRRVAFRIEARTK